MTETQARGELAALLDDLATFASRYVVLTAEQADAVALWVAHTHAVEAAEATPYLQVVSAEKRSGKSRLLEVLSLLVAAPLPVVHLSEAALFRTIASAQPTLLLDEYDALFGPRAAQHEGLRQLLNAGHRRGTTIYRCVGALSTPTSFAVFCAKALAGIGRLPDTVADRSIPIRLRRKRSDELAARFRRRDVEPEAAALRERIASWAACAVEELKSGWPALPDHLDDRAADGWEPLLAIAERASLDWARRAHEAALALSTGYEREDDSTGVQLLTAIQHVFAELEWGEITSHDLIEVLASLEESAFEELWDTRERGPAKGAQRRLADWLRPYGIRSRDLRLNGKIKKGYRREDFADAWERHLPQPGLGGGEG